MGSLTRYVVLGTLCFAVFVNSEEDLPCRARDVGIEGRSVVCVCDANYCDTITREAPAPGTFVAYTSSNAGQRFEKSYGVIEFDTIPVDPDSSESSESEESEEIDPEEGSGDGIIIRPPVLPSKLREVDVEDEGRETDIEDEGRETDIEDEELPDRAYDDEDLPEDANPSIWNRVSFRVFSNVRSQYIEGFGGSVTDAASINWRKLSDGAQTQLINTYFGPKGIEYNMIRVPIGGCDFSTHPYTYNEYPENDAKLSNFSLADEDLFYKLPMIKRSQMVATDEVKITASTWSPPVWMKTNGRITGFGQLKPEYYQAYADYHIKFMEAYERAEVKIWALTTTNEPLNGIIPIVNFNSLGWTPAQLGRWVANNLGPTVRNSRFNKTLIFAVDDQRYILPAWILGMELENPKSIEYIDGLAIHYYGNFFPAGILSTLQRRYPNKMLLSTEACEGPMPWDRLKVEVGSWRRARRYATSIMQDLNNFVVGWIDWNLCLDPDGGPNWANNFVDSPILVYADKDEFIKQPMYYAMGHFSKFIPRGSRKIRMSRQSLVTIENVAFLKPDGNYVIVLQNRRSRILNVRIRLTRRTFIELKMEPQSIKTIEINHEM